jgi:hypothetical protein
MMRLAVILGLLASPAVAFEPPNGCTPQLTIQYRSCLMSNIWTCDGDAAGEQWMGLFNAAGISRVRKVDREFQWLETILMNPVRTERMIVPAPDPENITELLETGADTYDFTIEQPDGSFERYVGYDRLTGDTTVIDDVVLDNTAYAYDVVNEAGEIVRSREGRQFISRDLRIFLFGESWDNSTPENVFSALPVEFLELGEVGFFPNQPLYDCGATMSSYEVSQ